MKLKTLVGLMGITLMSCSTTQSTAEKKNPEVHGHRGARWVRPENTLPAFQYALDQGVEVLELDLGVTQDNKLVVYHDQLLNPVFCKYKDGKDIIGDIPIHSLTLKQVKKIDCGSKVNPKFPEQQLVPGTEIPTLDEFFELITKHPNGMSVHFNIETKSEEAFPKYQPEPKKFAKLLLDSLRKHHVLDRTIIQSFDFRTLIEARLMEPTCVISALIEYRPKEALTEIAKRLKADIVSPDHEWLTADDVKALHAMKVQVAPWTANTEGDWKKLIGFGVDGIITDNPKALIEYLKNHHAEKRVQGSNAHSLVSGTGGL